MSRIAVFGCKSTTLFLIQALREKIAIDQVITISPEQGTKAEVADYCDLRETCSEYRIPCYTVNRYSLKNPDDLSSIRDMQLDAGFVIGWQRLIPGDILACFRIGVFGMHGSTDNLPKGRGRSPMNWSIIERRTHFYTNLFKYDPGTDSGDIVDTFVFSIQACETAETMHYKNVLAMKRLVLKNLNAIETGRINLRKQPDTIPTYYPKREPGDSLIDWRQDVQQIDAFIRAVTRPFNGAFSFIEGKIISIFRAQIFETDIIDYGYGNLEEGTVLEVFPGDKFLVKCRGGLLLVEDFESEKKIERHLIFRSPYESIRQFPMNSSGFHDMSI